MKLFVVADWHLCEDRMKIMGRPFGDGVECVEIMIANHNSIVSPDDRVLVLGDVLYQKANPHIWLPSIARFNGRKELVRGNHDRSISNDDFAPYFDTIHKEGSGIYLDAQGIECYCTHYPTCGVEDAFNLVGHIHSAWKVQLNMLNVGVDVHHFYPVNLADIAFFHKAITDYYDDDVWSAYDEKNSCWIGLRGKKGSYFNKSDETTEDARPSTRQV